MGRMSCGVTPPPPHCRPLRGPRYNGPSCSTPVSPSRPHCPRPQSECARWRRRHADTETRLLRRINEVASSSSETELRTEVARLQRELEVHSQTSTDTSEVESLKWQLEEADKEVGKLNRYIQRLEQVSDALVPRPPPPLPLRPLDWEVGGLWQCVPCLAKGRWECTGRRDVGRAAEEVGGGGAVVTRGVRGGRLRPRGGHTLHTPPLLIRPRAGGCTPSVEGKRPFFSGLGVGGVQLYGRC